MMKKVENNVVLVRKKYVLDVNEEQTKGKVGYNFYLYFKNTDQFVPISYVKFQNEKQAWKYYALINNSIDISELDNE